MQKLEGPETWSVDLQTLPVVRFTSGIALFKYLFHNSVRVSCFPKVDLAFRGPFNVMAV